MTNKKILSIILANDGFTLTRMDDGELTSDRLAAWALVNDGELQYVTGLISTGEENSTSPSTKATPSDSFIGMNFKNRCMPHSGSSGAFLTLRRIWPAP